MNKKFYEIKNQAGKAPEILIYGVIGSSWYEEGVTASTFVSDFKALEETNERINIRINSPGGSVFEGLAIFNVLIQSTCDVHTYIDGIAYSMAGIIALAGKTVHAAKNSLLLIHNASGLAWGHAQSMRDTGEQLDKYDSVIAQTIADKAGLKVEEVLAKYFDYKDHLLTAKEAKEAKLIDVLEELPAKNVPDGVENMKPHQVFAFYQQQMQPENSGIFNRLLGKIITNGRSAFAESQRPTEESKIYNQVEFDSAIKAVKDQYDAELFQAQADVDHWKAKAKEYGSQPGAMPTNAIKTGIDSEEIIQEGEVFGSHFSSDAQRVAQFQPRKK